ncbi:DUF5723 family protein [Flavilitoribacter nigricans]|uniref:DUF5723 domain-containing protein n=1 Tax=Flavilitoribacter nigricans (strain ATCC 23147 / DSM 23189 / NBRC 102662 / NCIMB 1420 / SS-2) TaxID=1122177 RepID=A0A2D0NHP8_FLAN2|nr:DUF5723 family protein [Flavilitoribacter nigricans]PHN08034.1 hypothetical protein CRP01_03190 [Flavilitoribacter nigricans DSM 23189 = NBRC 102662]
MRKSLFTIFLFVVSFSTIFAQQQELSTLLIPNTWQANRLNPAVVPDAKFVIGGPGLYNNLRVNNIVYNDLFGTNELGETALQIDNAIAKLGVQNRILENLDIETLSFGAKLGEIWLTLGHSLRSNAILNYPKTLPQLIWQGNAQFIGQTVSFGPQINMNTYHELSLGFVFEVTQTFTLGGRVKYLSGLNSISSQRNLLQLTTDDDVYQLTLDADYLVNSAGSLRYDGWNELDVAFNFGALTGENLFGKNSGTAFDLGASVQLGKLTLSASALDLGAGIKWKQDVHNYSLNGTYEYVGLDLAQNILEDDQALGSVLDTLREIYNPVETNDPYTTILPQRYYLNAGYQLTDSWHLGALVYYENGEFGLSEPAFAFAANTQIIPQLNIGGTFAYRHEQFSNLGLNLSLQLGPARILVATDNIFTAIRPKESHSANVRLGTSLLFGKTRPAGRGEAIY